MPPIVPGVRDAGLDLRLVVAGLLACAACAAPANDAAHEPARREPARREPIGETREVPRMLNREPPFRYPAALYAQRVQGNVTLRLVVDSGGRVTPESTRVAESSGHPALDSAALRGASALSFAPALREGRPVAAHLRFPVYFRHPAARPLPGDPVAGR
jgi:protein TonB